jgi:hypothetical protein
MTKRRGISLVWLQPSLFTAPSMVRCQSATGIGRCQELSVAVITWTCPHRHKRRAKVCDTHVTDARSKHYCRTCRVSRSGAHPDCPLSVLSVERRGAA